MESNGQHVFIVDDDPGIRKSLSLLVESVGLTPKAYASAGEFLDDYDRQMPGCLIADVRMPGMNGIELQSHLIDNDIEIPVVILTGHGDTHLAVQAIKAGAVDFIEKPFREQQVLDSISEAISIDNELRLRRADRVKVQMMLAELTEREVEVMNLLVAGKSNKEAAANLGISRKTVDFHRVRIMEKLGVRSLVELTLLVNRVKSKKTQPSR